MFCLMFFVIVCGLFGGLMFFMFFDGLVFDGLMGFFYVFDGFMFV